LEAELAKFFSLPMEDGKHIAQAEFTPKTPNVKLEFTVEAVGSAVVNELQQLAATFSLFYNLSKVTHRAPNEPPSGPWVWTDVLAGLTLSPDKKTVTKTAPNGHPDSCAMGSVGWNNGVHEWKLLVSGSGGSTTNDRIHIIRIGVTTQAINNYHVAGTNFVHSSYGGSNCNMGVVSGDNTPTPPNTVVTVTLDCDAGTLAFAQNGNEFLKINVPKNTILYPWVHLYSTNNVVTIVD
jgi:hypothetical protein